MTILLLHVLATLLLWCHKIVSSVGHIIEKIFINIAQPSLFFINYCYNFYNLAQWVLSVRFSCDMHHVLILAICDSRYRLEKISILSDLIRKTNAQEMKWIIMIILKGGISMTSLDSSVLSFHLSFCFVICSSYIILLISTSLLKSRSQVGSKWKKHISWISPWCWGLVQRYLWFEISLWKVTRS